MAKNQTKRLQASVIADDLATINAVKNITGYNPSNPAHKVAALDAAVATMHAAQVDYDQKTAAAATAQDVLIKAEWDAHNAALGVKDEVRAQYGKDSNEVQEIGLKKPSEYKKPKRKAKPTEPSK